MDHDIPMSLKMGAKSFEGIKTLDEGRSVDEKDILELCDFIDYRLDCADFRMMTILRVLYSYSHLISQETLSRMKKTVLSFKYWMDEPGDDSMCFWSENHQILFFTAGYLAGKLFSKELFENSNRRGVEMMSVYRPRILAWLKHRYEHGFIEWHSNTYYEEDIPPLTLLIDFGDEELAKKATIILDLLLADMAMHNFKGLFSVTSGRCYEEQKRQPLKQDVLEINEFLFGKRYCNELDYSRIASNLYLCQKYKMPDLFRDIANDETTQVIKTSMGHDLKELKSLVKEKGAETAGYVQWAMESFTNPEAVQLTMDMYRKYNMKSNDFLKDLGVLNKRGIHFILPTVTRILNPITNGVAIQKVNSYTYRHKDFIMSTAQKHYPGTFGDQQHIWQATINENISIFTTHPGASFFDDNARNFSPSYWVGNGIMPHSIQEKNVHMSIYKVDQRKGFMEKERQYLTHAHFPQNEFDQVKLEENYLFAKKGPVKVALIGKNKLSFSREDSNDLLQFGKITYWICEIISDNTSLDEFINKIRHKHIGFHKNKLSYGSMILKYKGDFLINHKKIDTDYKRLESSYGNFDRKDKAIEITFKNKKLQLNFEEQSREEVIE